VGPDGGDDLRHPGAQRQGADDLLVELGFVGGAPQADAAQFADRAPQPYQFAGGGQLRGADGFGGAEPVDLGRVGGGPRLSLSSIVGPRLRPAPRPAGSLLIGAASYRT